MAAILGNKNKAYIRTTVEGEDVYTWLGCETGSNVDRSQEAVECSDKSDTWAKFIPAARGGTFQVNCYADNTDDGQVLALKGLHEGTRVVVFIGQLEEDDEDALVPTEGELGSAVVTGISDTNDFGSVAARTINLTLDGPLTHYPEEENQTPQANVNTGDIGNGGNATAPEQYVNPNNP